MAYTIPKKKGKKVAAPPVRPIITLERPETTEKIPPSEYIEHKCHNVPGDSTSGQYTVKIPRYGSGTPEDWLIFTDLVKKAISGQNITTGPAMYNCMERVLKGDAKAEFISRAIAEGNSSTEHYKAVMKKMTKHVFPAFAYRDQKRYLSWYLRKPVGMKVKAFSTRLVQLNEYLPFSPPETEGQEPSKLSDDDMKDILYHAMPNSWKQKMTEQGYNYIAHTLTEMTEFFETRIENLETPVETKKGKKGKGKKKVRISEPESEASSSSSDESDKPTKKKCKYHGWCNHTTEQCTTLKELIRKAKKRNKKPKKAGKTYTKHEVNALFKKKFKKAMKKKGNNRVDELNNFEGMKLSDSEKSDNDDDVSMSSFSSETSDNSE